MIWGREQGSARGLEPRQGPVIHPTRQTGCDRKRLGCAWALSSGGPLVLPLPHRTR